MPTTTRGTPGRRDRARLTAVLFAGIVMGWTTPDALGATGAQKCAAAKIKAAGKKVYAKAKCHQKAILTGAGVDSACLAKAELKFSTAIGKADLMGSCPGTATGIESTVDDCIDALAAEIATTTTSTSAPTTTTEPVSTFTTTTSSSTSTTLGSHPTCCHSGTATFGVCTQLATSDCSIMGTTFTAGPDGTECDGATGTCVVPPPAPGRCCQPAISTQPCIAGTITPSDCTTYGGTFMTPSICTTSGCTP